MDTVFPILLLQHIYLCVYLSVDIFPSLSSVTKHHFQDYLQWDCLHGEFEIFETLKQRNWFQRTLVGEPKSTHGKLLRYASSDSNLACCLLTYGHFYLSESILVFFYSVYLQVLLCRWVSGYLFAHNQYLCSFLTCYAKQLPLNWKDVM